MLGELGVLAVELAWPLEEGDDANMSRAPEDGVSTRAYKYR